VREIGYLMLVGYLILVSGGNEYTDMGIEKCYLRVTNGYVCVVWGGYDCEYSGDKFAVHKYE
jgi:hypothetical protein